MGEIKLYYYRYMLGDFLEGTAEELSRFHLDYLPQPTRNEALREFVKFVIGKVKWHNEMAVQLLGQTEIIPWEA